jgi:hypothetical protein
VEGLEDPPPAPERPCKSITADFTKRQMSALGSCTKAIKFKNGKEKAKSMNVSLREFWHSCKCSFFLYVELHAFVFICILYDL